LSPNVKLVSKDIPLPKKLFSFIPPPIVPPDVPYPAPKEISPVGFSSTVIFTTFVSAVSPSTTSEITVLKIFFDLILLIVLLCKISLKASPSSTKKEFLITFSLVMVFPKISIL